MQAARVFRSIERPAHWLGLELTDAYIWLMSFMLIRYLRLYALIVSAALWVLLFAIRFRRPPRFLMSFIGFHLQRALFAGRYAAYRPESAGKAWLSLRRQR